VARKVGGELNAETQRALRREEEEFTQRAQRRSTESTEKKEQIPPLRASKLRWLSGRDDIFWCEAGDLDLETGLKMGLYGGRSLL